MELPMSQEEEEMPIPLNTRYVGEPIIQNHNITPSSPPQFPSTHDYNTNNNNNNNNNNNIQLIPSTKKMVIIKYKECLKNHAASMGGNATDGCGEFMPSGEYNTLEALICSACNCHRNFHRKEVEGQVQVQVQVQQPSSFNNNNNCYYNVNPNISRKISVGHPQNYHSGRLVMSYNNNNNNNMGCYDNSDDEEGGGGGGVGRPSQVVKKRFRTKFSTEQREKMLKFAEKVGWKMQKQEEGMVQQFCQEVGVKRRVLKVWMHNNKHNFTKKTNVMYNDDDHQNHV